MTATTKTYRTKNPDQNKTMQILYASELSDLSEARSIMRTMTMMPTGMEREEEMETHLQEAINSQQATTSGMGEATSVIPTPKVYPIETERYERIYQTLGPTSSHLMRVQAWEALEHEKPVYDCDSDDEKWLKRKKGQVTARELERVFTELEAKSSDTQIILPDNARRCVQSISVHIIDMVYDYWLTKRKTKLQSGQPGGLIPKIRTEAKKEGQINPYIAFRRRIEKMQTRRNRKNDEDAYENGLRLSRDLRRAVQLADMVKRREKTKLALIESDIEILQTHFELDDYDPQLYMQLVNSLRDKAKEPIADEPSVPRKKARRRRVMPDIDREVPNRAWLEKNEELWNVPIEGNLSTVLNSNMTVEVPESDDSDPYEFQPYRWCAYAEADPIAVNPLCQDSDLESSESELMSANEEEDEEEDEEEELKDEEEEAVENEVGEYEEGQEDEEQQCEVVEENGESEEEEPFTEYYPTRVRIGRGGRRIVERKVIYYPPEVYSEENDEPSCSHQDDVEEKEEPASQEDEVRLEDRPLLIPKAALAAQENDKVSLKKPPIGLGSVFENSPSEESRSCSPVFPGLPWHSTAQTNGTANSAQLPA
ncbi:unnamed protein product, partial [Mesorhabditis spiculigera]